MNDDDISQHLKCYQ